jgi:hypothetical protein
MNPGGTSPDSSEVRFEDVTPFTSARSDAGVMGVPQWHKIGMTGERPHTLCARANRASSGPFQTIRARNVGWKKSNAGGERERGSQK